MPYTLRELFVFLIMIRFYIVKREISLLIVSESSDR